MKFVCQHVMIGKMDMIYFLVNNLTWQETGEDFDFSFGKTLLVILAGYRKKRSVITIENTAQVTCLVGYVLLFSMC